MDLMLRLQTIRWNSDNVFEIGFPHQQKNRSKANLCFAGLNLLANVSFPGHEDIVLYVDTGDNGTELFPPFASGQLDSLIPDARKTVETWGAHGERGEWQAVTLSSITLGLGKFQRSLTPMLVLLERHRDIEEFDGVLGMRMLNQARRVSFDF